MKTRTLDIMKKVCRVILYSAFAVLLLTNLMAIRPIYYAMKDISQQIQRLRASTNAFEVDHMRQIDRL